MQHFNSLCLILLLLGVRSYCSALPSLSLKTVLLGFPRSSEEQAPLFPVFSAGSADDSYEDSYENPYFSLSAGKKKRSPESEVESDNQPRKLEAQELADLLKDTPWALIAVKDFSTPKRTYNTFTPRLGRSSEESFSVESRGNQFSPRLGQRSRPYNPADIGFGGSADYGISPTFVPRLGRSQDSVSRDDNRHKDSSNTKIAPRLSRIPMSPRLGRSIY